MKYRTKSIEVEAHAHKPGTIKAIHSGKEFMISGQTFDFFFEKIEEPEQVTFNCDKCKQEFPISTCHDLFETLLCFKCSQTLTDSKLAIPYLIDKRLDRISEQKLKEFLGEWKDDSKKLIHQGLFTCGECKLSYKDNKMAIFSDSDPYNPNVNTCKECFGE